LKRELAWTLQSLRELRADLAELRAAVLARQRADAELASLYRERAIARARAAERDPLALSHLALPAHLGTVRRP